METNKETRDDHSFIKYLKSLTPEKDSGVLADLRRGFSKATETRAWAHLGAWVKLNDDFKRIVYQTIAAGYATHQLDDSTPWNNFGTVMRKLVGENDSSGQSPTFDVYFRRLLACGTVEELCERLKSPIRAAKSKDVPIPWNSLFWDLLSWEKKSDEIKLRWATQYWDVPKEVGDFVSDNDSGDVAEENDE